MQAVSLPLPVCSVIEATPEHKAAFGQHTFGIVVNAECPDLQPQSLGLIRPGDVLVCLPGEPMPGGIAIVEVDGRVSAVQWLRQTVNAIRSATPPAKVIGRKVSIASGRMDPDWKHIAAGRDVPRYWLEGDR